MRKRTERGDAVHKTAPEYVEKGSIGGKKVGQKSEKQNGQDTNDRGGTV